MSHLVTAPGQDLDRALEEHRRALTGYCYRMLGSWFEAEDAVQETMVRAWRSADRLQERAALKSWLYRIATNVCLDALQSAKRRARPIDLQDPQTPESQLGPQLAREEWVLPAPDSAILPESADPAELAEAKETVRLAFVAALQHLPPRQRAVLILCEVLRWKASEVAELLETSVASVNSALQRARATLESGPVALDTAPRHVESEEHVALLARYVRAFESYDIESLVALIHEDATFSMPPWELWLRGPEDIGKWFLGQGIACKGSKLLITRANGCPAVATYKPDPEQPAVLKPWNLHVLELVDGKIAAVHNFIYPELFQEFGLPAELSAR